MNAIMHVIMNTELDARSSEVASQPAVIIYMHTCNLANNAQLYCS